MQKLVVLTGAGVSAESGIQTFRDSNGLWENHNIVDVASPEGWRKNQELVQNFYNQRRKQLGSCQPNEAHKILANLENQFDVQIITQNIDDLHERAGSTHVLHLHGELSKAQSSIDPSLVYPLTHWEIKTGDRCEKGSQLRPFIVWFGEEVPMMMPAMKIAETADIFLVLGTSMQVYPAASLIDYVPRAARKFLIDLQMPNFKLQKDVTVIQDTATEGMKKLEKILLNF